MNLSYLQHTKQQARDQRNNDSIKNDQLRITK